MPRPVFRRPATVHRDRFREELGERITTARERAGLKQCELAKLVGMSGNWMSQIERGSAEPSAWDLACIAEELDETIEALVPITERGR